MKYNELVQLFFERSNALQWYWTLYVVIIGGLLAFSSLRKQPDHVTGLLVTLLYAAFAYKNLSAIHDVTLQRQAVLGAINESSNAASVASGTGAESTTDAHFRVALQPTLVAPAYAGVRNFHVTCDILTVAALWAMELRRRRYAPLNRAMEGAPPGV